MVHATRRFVSLRRLRAQLRRLGCEPANQHNVGYEYWKTPTGRILSVPNAQHFNQRNEPQLYFADAFQILGQAETLLKPGEIRTGRKPAAGNHVGNLDRRDH